MYFSQSNQCPKEKPYIFPYDKHPVFFGEWGFILTYTDFNQWKHALNSSNVKEAFALLFAVLQFRLPIRPHTQQVSTIVKIALMCGNYFMTQQIRPCTGQSMSPATLNQSLARGEMLNESLGWTVRQTIEYLWLQQSSQFYLSLRFTCVINGEMGKRKQ